MESATTSTTQKRRRSGPVRLSAPTKGLLLVTLLAALLFYVQGGLSVQKSQAGNSDTIAANVATLAALEAATPPDFEALAAEKAAARIAAQREELIANKGIQVEDLAAEQAKIVATDPSSVSKADLNRWFSGGNAVIIGDSIASGASSYGWLDESLVFAKVGVSVSSATELIDEAMATNPSVIFMSFGLNDIAAYGSNVEKFIQVYTETLERMQQELPDALIYVNGLFPGSASATASNSYYKYLDTYNEELEKLCDSLEGTVFYVYSGFLFEELPELYEQDGKHAKSKFYGLWLSYFADIAGLSNETDDTESE